jgi:hypothetical protein
MHRSYRIAMPPLALDLLSAMLCDRVVATDQDRAARNKALDNMLRDSSGQIPTPPTPFRKHAVIAAPVAIGQRPRNSQKPTDGVPTNTNNRRKH